MIRAVGSLWLAFWGDLNTPSSFPADPEGGLKNQGWHILIGFYLSACLCIVWALIAGEMPHRAGVWLTVTAGYFWVIELRRQQWQGADTLIDTAFVGLGAALPLVSLKEVALRPEIDLRLQMAGAVLVFVAIPVALAAYGLPRLYRKYYPGAKLGAESNER